MTRIEFDMYDMMASDRHQTKMDSRRKGAVTKKACNPKNDKVGFLGELAVKKYLDSMEIEYEEHADDTGKYGDTWDIKIAGEKIDVKASERYKDKIVLNEDQYNKALKHNTRLIGVHINLSIEHGDIIGKCFPKDLERDESEDFTYKGKEIKMYSKKF